MLLRTKNLLRMTRYETKTSNKQETDKIIQFHMQLSNTIPSANKLIKQQEVNCVYVHHISLICIPGVRVLPAQCWA